MEWMACRFDFNVSDAQPDDDDNLMGDYLSDEFMAICMVQAPTFYNVHIRPIMLINLVAITGYHLPDCMLQF